MVLPQMGDGIVDEDVEMRSDYSSGGRHDDHEAMLVSPGALHAA